MKKIIAIIGARPQFIKHAPIDIAFKSEFNLLTIHTGQHYDDNMSKVFFDELSISPPDYQLELGGGLHGEQTGQMLTEIEKIYISEKPDAVIVYGDTNSTLAGALAAAKLHIPVIHIEAGLRSFNKKMPEEINRILTDQISDLLICPNTNAEEQLKKENIKAPIYITGDIMADMLYIAKKNIKKVKEEYIFVTLHRPYNTDNQERLSSILEHLNALETKIKFALHPRTKKMMHTFGIMVKDYPNIEFVEPLSYFENIKALANSKALITDSGGMQKEAYLMKIRCITIRTETEWTETLNGNWNTLVFENLSEIKTSLTKTLGKYEPNVYGDGKAAIQILEIIKNFFNPQEEEEYS